MTVPYSVNDIILQRSQQKTSIHRISWSKQGHIAYANPDFENDPNNNLYITYMECINGKSWQLAPPTKFTITDKYHNNNNSNSTSDSNSDNKGNNNNNKKSSSLLSIKNSSNSSSSAITATSPSSSSSSSSRVFPNNLNYISFSITGWDLFLADEYGHVSILVTGIKKTTFTHPSPSKDSTNSDGNTPSDGNKKTSNGTNGNTNPSIPNSPPQAPSITSVQYSRTSFNSAEIIYKDSNDPNTNTTSPLDPNPIVEMKWLNMDKSVIANIPAVRVPAVKEPAVLNGAASQLGSAYEDASGYYYSYNVHQYRSYGAMHPLATKQACIGVRRKGEVCLWYQEDHGIEYKRISGSLLREDEIKNGVQISLAGIGFQKDGRIIIVAYCDRTKSVHFYSVVINWSFLLLAVKQLQKNATYRVPDNERIPPKLLIRKLFKQDIENVDATGLQKLTHIQVVSPNYYSKTELDILFAFENIRVNTDEPIRTKLVRYQLDEKEIDAGLHSAFITIAQRRGIENAGKPSSSTDVKTSKEFVLKFVQELKFNESIVSFDVANLEMVVSITFANGKVKIFDRIDLKPSKNIFTKKSNSDEEIMSENNISKLNSIDKSTTMSDGNNINKNTNGENKNLFLSSIEKKNISVKEENESSTKIPLKSQPVLLPPTIGSLFDAGFEFPRCDFQPIYTKLSPNYCCYVALPAKGSKLYIKCAETVIDENNLPPNRKGLLLSTTAAFALKHTGACYLGASADDLFATIRNELEKSKITISPDYSFKLMNSILQESQRAINITVDIAPDSADKMIQSQPLQRILNLQLTLGTNYKWRRDKSGKIAWSIINLRYVASSVMYTIHTVYQNMQKFVKKGANYPESLEVSKARAECISFALGTIRWCIDYIIELNKELFEISMLFEKYSNEIKNLNNSNKLQIPDILQKRIDESIVLPLILGKIPRSFLLFSIANIKRLFVFVQKFVEKHDPSISGYITQDNPLGAFKYVQDRLMNKKFDKLIPDIKDPLISIPSAPTVESYHRLGSILNNCPVNISTFEKFLSETDIPLRNLGLDQMTSLAIEQQLLNEGTIAKIYIEPLKKLCAVYSASVKKSTDVPELVFYNTDWLHVNKAFDGDDDDDGDDEECDVDNDGDIKMEQEEDNKRLHDKNKNNNNNLIFKSKEHIKEELPVLLEFTKNLLSKESLDNLIDMNLSPDGYLIDSLRKCLYDTKDFVDEDNCSLMRKCVRCGSVSLNVDDVIISMMGHPSIYSNPMFQHYQRLCFCGGSWTNV
ncbi:hypothetical protein B5S31_g2730 [[Candida] boidinii]|nr:hypothetical protein B5S31_g2730 [[Candida] boidinii]